jgi:hypothetical protein
VLLGGYDFPRLLRYLLAGCASFLVVLLTAVMPQSWPSRISPTILFAVVLVRSGCGGFGPGAAAAISAVGATELLLPTSATPLLTRAADTPLMVTFLAVAYALSSIKRRRNNPSRGPATTYRTGGEAPSAYQARPTCSTCGSSEPFQDPTNGANLWDFVRSFGF